MTDHSNKTLLVIDQGLFLSFALRMAQPGGFAKVLYYNDDRRRGRPSFQEVAVGTGYDEIEVVDSPWEALDKCDMVAFPDVMDWEMQVWLRQQGVKVWGAGAGAQLELYRVFAKKIMAAVKIPVGPYIVVKGISRLREHLEKHEDRILKVSYVRGLMESRKHRKWWLSKNFILGLEFRLGPLAEKQEFIIEERIETKIEAGSDQVFVDHFPDKVLCGNEIKDSSYLGVVQAYDDLPEELRSVNDALEPVLRDSKYANFFSTEVRIAADGTPYPVDLTCRQGSPSGEAQLAIWKNIPEIVWAGAHGEHVEPEYAAKWVAQAMIFNNGDEAEWCPVSIPKNLNDNVRLYFALRRGEESWVVPQSNPFDEIGSVVAIGNTAEEAKTKCKEMADQIEGNISVKVECLDEAEEEFAVMAKKGMPVTPIKG